MSERPYQVAFERLKQIKKVAIRKKRKTGLAKHKTVLREKRRKQALPSLQGRGKPRCFVVVEDFCKLGKVGSSDSPLHRILTKPSIGLSCITSAMKLLCLTWPLPLSDNRTITPDDHQKFAKSVSKKWKQVGRSLQKSCRALRDPAIDNLALEYDREGLYEQAYQMLLRFLQSEGKRATIARLIAALEENGLVSLAEELLGLHSSEECS